MINVGVSRVHNSAVTLLKDGELVFHIENERLSNIKYDAYPFHALAKLPEHVSFVDNVCLAGVGKTVPVECFQSVDAYTTFISRLNRSFFDHDIHIHDLWEHHHKLHASCAFYNSGFESAICIIKDGMGSDYTINDARFIPGSFGRENGSTFTASYPASFNLIDKHVVVGFECDVMIDNIRVSNNSSEALAFQKTSKQFGFHELDAGKVMGMSSYGKTDNYKIFKDGIIPTDIIGFKSEDVRTGYLIPNVGEDFQAQADFARSLQKQTQEHVKQYILKMVEQTGIKNVCLSGGFFLNCVANYEYLKDLPKDIKLYIEPISSDAGTSLGAAKLVHHETTGDMTIRPQTTLYHGFIYNYTDQQVYEKLKEGESIRKVLPSEVAQLIADRNIVAMFQGRSEAGPRALGNRSILYDPRDPNGKDFVNLVKQREWFRPFAGSILHEETNKWFDMRGLEESPYMMYAVNVLQPEKIPAISHIDGTCRVQTVKPEQNKHYYDLIKAFNDITGVPILFNTSFNLAGDCIVETIDDALDTLRRCDIKYLYLPELQTLLTK
jgi:carbamoyltransferase